MQNTDQIIKIMKEAISSDKKRLLEFYAGPENCAKEFARHFKNIEWVSTNITKDEFPKFNCDLVFTANTLHLLDWKKCKSWMKLLGTRLREGSQVFIYGAFSETGERSIENINRVMIKNGFAIYKDFELSDNNHLLVFTRLIFMKDSQANKK
jgi:chemotaxis methyl-accepting protein methylase